MAESFLVPADATAFALIGLLTCVIAQPLSKALYQEVMTSNMRLCIIAFLVRQMKFQSNVRTGPAEEQRKQDH